MMNKNSIFSGLADSTHTIFLDEFDLINYKEAKQYSPELLKAEKQGIEKYPPFSELQQDIYASVIRIKPLLLEKHQISYKFLLNRELITQVMELPKYKEVRVYTVGDKLLSTIATELLSEQALELLDKLKPQCELQQTIVSITSKLKELQDSFETQVREQAPEQIQNESKLSIEQAKQELEKYKAQLHKDMQSPLVKNLLTEMVSDVVDNLREESEFLEAWGLGAGATQQTPYHEKIALTQKLKSSTKLKQIAKLAGRFKRLALQQQSEKIRKGSDEIFSVKTGNDLSRILPTELIKIHDPAREDEFFINYIEGKCLQYDVRAKAKRYKGAIVGCIDNSMSMAGEPEVWAKAVILALLEIARAQKRNFACICFSSGYKAEDLKTFSFPKNEPVSIEQIIELAQFFDAGGTEFEPPLDRSKFIIEEEPNFISADIIFVTDGEAVVRDAWLRNFNQWRTSHKVAVFSILIDKSFHTSKTIKSFSDQVLTLTDIAKSGEMAAVQIFSSI